jgi:twinkle protein
MLTKAAMQEMDTRVSYHQDGTVEYFFFTFHDNQGNIIGAKAKNPNNKKDTWTVGEVSQAQGLHKYRDGGRKLVVTEGEQDRAAVYTAMLQIYGKTFPAISMGGVDQVKFLAKERDVLRKFNEVVLWFDNDEQGARAVEKAAKAIGYDKVKVVHSEAKDANDALRTVPPGEIEPTLAHGAKLVNSLIHQASVFNPSGVVYGRDTWDLYLKAKDIEFVPWPPFLEGLNRLSYGRAMSSITMFAAGTACGKTSLLKEDIKFLLDTTDERVGAVFLEDDITDIVQGLMGLELNKRIGLPGVEVSEEEARGAWERTLGTDRLVLIDHQGSLSDSSLLDKIEYLAVIGCKFIYLDHITLAVSGSSERDPNKAIDQFMSELLRIVKRHGCWVGAVSHLRKVGTGEDSFESGAPVQEDDLKGSGSLKQIAFQTIALSRNKLAEDEEKRHKTAVWLLKDRKTGASGFAGYYKYDTATGRMASARGDEEPFEREDVTVEEPLH